MLALKRAKRVRLHLIDRGAVALPSVEGLLVAKRGREYVIGLPALISSPQEQPTELESRLLVIPRENVAFYEVVSG